MLAVDADHIQEVQYGSCYENSKTSLMLVLAVWFTVGLQIMSAGVYNAIKTQDFASEYFVKESLDDAVRL